MRVKLRKAVDAPWHLNARKERSASAVRLKLWRAADYWLARYSCSRRQNGLSLSPSPPPALSVRSSGRESTRVTRKREGEGERAASTCDRSHHRNASRAPPAPTRPLVRSRPRKLLQALSLFLSHMPHALWRLHHKLVPFSATYIAGILVSCCKWNESMFQYEL